MPCERGAVGNRAEHEVPASLLGGCHPAIEGPLRVVNGQDDPLACGFLLGG
jgi:hypothetical protein